MIFTAEEAEQLGTELGIEWDQVDFTPADLAAGMDIELEHGTAGGERVNVTEDDPAMTAQIALAHLLEYSNYYDDEGLTAMEDQLAELLSNKLEKEAQVRVAYQIEKQVKQEVRHDMSPELDQYVKLYTQGIQDLVDGGTDAGEAFKKTQPDLDDMTADDLVNLLWENQHLGGRGQLTKLAPLLSVLDIFDVIQKLLERAIWDASRLWWGKQKTQQAEPGEESKEVTLTRTQNQQEAAEQRDDVGTEVAIPKKDASTMQQFTYQGHVYVAEQRTCEQRDMDQGRPATEQKVCLFNKDNSKLLGRHPDKESADEQEAAIHAGAVQQGNKLVVRKSMQYIKLAEVPAAAVKSLYQDKWGEGIMKALGEDFPLDSKAAQFLFFSVWNGVIQLMDKVLMGKEVDTTKFSDDPTFMQSLAGLSYFVTDDAIKSSLGVKSDSLEKGAGHAEALMAVLGQEADVAQTLEDLKGQAGPIVEKAFDQVTGYLKDQPAAEPEQKAASTKRTRAEMFCAFVRSAAFGDEDAEDWADQPRDYTLTIWYDVVTPESAEDGDVDHRGYSVDGQDYPLEENDLPLDDDEVMSYGSLVELVDDLDYSRPWEGWGSEPAVPGDGIYSQPDENFQDGSVTSYHAFMQHRDGSDLNGQEMQYIHDRLRLMGKVSQQQRKLPLEATTEEPTPTQPTTPDQTIQAWVAGLPRDAAGPMSIRLYDVVAQDGSREDYRAAAAQEGLYVPAGKLDVPYLQDYLRQEMNDQAAVVLNDGPLGRVGTFQYAEQQGQWGLQYSTPAVEDLVQFVKQARKTDRGPGHKPLGRGHGRDRDSRAPAMQLTQQLGKEVREREPAGNQRAPESTKEQDDSKLMRALKWLQKKSHEASTPRTANAAWGRLRQAAAWDHESGPKPGGGLEGILRTLSKKEQTGDYLKVFNSKLTEDQGPYVDALQAMAAKYGLTIEVKDSQVYVSRATTQAAGPKKSIDTRAQTKQAGCGCSAKETTMKTASNWNFDDVNHSTGFADGDTFLNDQEVMEYFTVENMDEMFTEHDLDQATLDSMADAVVDNDWHMERLAAVRKTVRNKTAETFRGFDLAVVPQLAQQAIQEIKLGQEDDYDNQDSGFEYYLEDVVHATGIPEDWASALGIPTDDQEWANAVEGGWEWDYIQEAIDEIDGKIAEAMDRSGLPGGLSLGSNEGSGDFGLIYFIDYDEAEQHGIADPTQTERRW